MMSPCKIAIFALLWLAWAGMPPVQARSEAPTLFDSESFWAEHPVDFGAREAWQSGTKFQRPGQSAVTVFHSGRLFGFVEREFPADKDRSVYARLKQTYANRAEQQAIRAAGLFAFHEFQCSALAGYERFKPDLTKCSSIPVQAKMTSDWQGRAFSVVQLSVEEICACRQALDQSKELSNAGIFFAEIARQELHRLYQENRLDDFWAFFIAHYRKRIFMAPELILAAEIASHQNRFPEATELLKAVTAGFGSELNSEQWEQCGDLYYSVGRKEQAQEAWQQASEALFQ